MKKPVRQFLLVGTVVATGLAVVLLWTGRPVRVAEASAEGSDTQFRTVSSPAPDGPNSTRTKILQPIPSKPVETPIESDASARSPIRFEVRVEEEEGVFSFIRYVDEVTNDPVTGEPMIVRTEAMLADHVVLSVPSGADAEEVRRSVEALGYTVARSWSFSPAWQIGLGRHDVDAVPEALALIRSALPDLRVEPDFVYRPLEIPDDYDPVKMWGLKKIQAPAAWSVSQGSSSVMAAIIDSGADLFHPDLVANLWTNPGEIANNGIDDDQNGLVDDIHGWDFAENDNLPQDDGPEARHGTHVAGTISAAGNNGKGLVGVNWNTKLIIARVGDQSFPSSALIASVNYVTKLRQAGVNVVVTNNSYGGSTSNSSMRAAIRDARDAGILFVAAAGNDGINNDTSGNASYPASYDVENVISVASSNLADKLSIFSNYGPTTVDLAAPGSAIRSTVPALKGFYGYLSGTSMASPHVAGAVTLLKAAEPDLDWRALKQRVFDTVDKVPALNGRVATDGRLNLRRLLGLESTPLEASVTVPAGRTIVLDDVSVVLNLTGSTTGDTVDLVVDWESVLGPAPVSFSQPDAHVTEVGFSQPGTYQLRFRATSSVESSEDEVTVVVATPEVTDEGLAGFWKFEGTNGTTATDSSGNGRTGSLAGVERTVGSIGKAASFDGEIDVMTFDTAPTERITITAWVRSDSLGESVFPRILETARPLPDPITNPDPNPDFIFYFGRRTGVVDADINSIKFYASKSVQAGIWHTANDSIGDGQWLHVGVSYDGSSDETFPSIFLNGEVLPVGVDARSGDQARGVVGQQQQTVGLGHIGENVDGERAWDGLIDEVRYYTRALNRAEVAWIAAESRVRPLLDAPIVFSGDPELVQPFMIRADGLSQISGRSFRWELDSGEPLAFVGGKTTPEVAVVASTGGSRRLRLTMTSGEVTVVRTVGFDLATGNLPSAGRFEGGFSSDGGSGAIWAEVDSSGSARMLGLDADGDSFLLGSGIALSPDGRFEFVSSDGSVFLGQFDQDGFVGGSADGLSVFSGDRVSTGSEEPVRVLTGPVVNSEDDRFHAWVKPDGSLFLVRVATEQQDGAMGSLASDGSFDLETSGGASVAGQIDLASMSGRGTIDDGSEDSAFHLAAEEDYLGERLANISTRGVVGEGDSVMIAGLVVLGSPDTRALIRGVGPSLASFDLPRHAGATSLVLRSGNTVLASSEGWGSNPNAAEIESLSENLGAFPFESESGDSAILSDLLPGVYTVSLENPSDEDGLALLEVYDAGEESSVRLVNLSTRGPAGLGEEALIAGFVLNEKVPRRILIRAIGPGLGVFGVEGFMANPKIRLVGEDGELAENDDWDADDRAELLTELGARVGAFGLEPGSLDASLVRYLDPGAYTVQVEPAEGDPGVALVEIYVVPEN